MGPSKRPGVTYDHTALSVRHPVRSEHRAIIGRKLRRGVGASLTGCSIGHIGLTRRPPHDGPMRPISPSTESVSMRSQVRPTGVFCHHRGRPRRLGRSGKWIPSVYRSEKLDARSGEDATDTRGAAQPDRLTRASTALGNMEKKKLNRVVIYDTRPGGIIFRVGREEGEREMSQQPTFNELLIQEVQNHPELYDQHHRVCTDNGERNLLWEEIAGRIDGSVPGEFAKKRWLQMRDRYRKELKLALRNTVQPKWPYFEKLTWLDPYLKDSKNSTLAPSLLGSNQFENSAKDSSMENSERNVKEEFSDFPFTNEISTNMLLENIMAASSSAFNNSFLQASNRRRDQLDSFSPDSAIASTSEDGDAHPTASSSDVPSSEANPEKRSDENRCHQIPGQLDANPAKFERSADVQSIGNDDGLSSLNESVLSSNSSQVSATGNTPVEHGNASTNEDNAENNNASPSSPAFDLNIALARNLSQWSSGRPRFRNPPYLVRRGGGIKLKQPGAVSNGPLNSSLKPLAKTLSAGGIPFGGAFHANTSVGSAQPAECRQVTSSSNASALSPALPATSSGSTDWLRSDASNDEDALFARLIVVRLKKFTGKDKRAIRARISELIDEKEEEIERTSNHAK